MTQLFRAARMLKDHLITPRLHLMLDELGNMAAIENLPRYVTECASRNISIMMCLQSLEQLNHLYGESRAATIIDSVNIFVTFRVNSVKTMNWISAVSYTHLHPACDASQLHRPACKRKNRSFRFLQAHGA